MNGGEGETCCVKVASAGAKRLPPLSWATTACAGGEPQRRRLREPVAQRDGVTDGGAVDEELDVAGDRARVAASLSVRGQHDRLRGGAGCASEVIASVVGARWTVKVSAPLLERIAIGSLSSS